MIKKLSGLLLFTAILFTGCKEEGNLPPQTEYANLIIYNGATGFLGDADSAKAFVYIDTANSPKDYPAIKLNYNYVYPGPFTGIPSPVQYMAVKTGQRRLRFALPNNDKITDHVFDMADHTYQTAYLTDSLSYMNVLLTRDTLVRLEDKARMRLINLSPDAGPVQLYLDTLAVTNLKSRGYKSVAEFVPVDRSDYAAIRIRSLKDETLRTLIRKSIPIRAGGSYTVILRGYMNPPDKDPNKSINLSVLINQ
ncbi:hypothetical protein GCM10023149_15790 [Mucilaginibacter gynuensis]|uniref:DUF4397 domain-containing protein n=2 Tax=Mucilaginibacter gynuensis TaxID=1302236 RepID=A0ABP8G5L3_9SPHI